MGDDEVLDKLGKMDKVDMMKHLIEMKKKIDADTSDYYFPPKAKTPNQMLREKYPAAQDAWEKYQAVLTLCRTEETNGR